jgi:hypothetical protein
VAVSTRIALLALIPLTVLVVIPPSARAQEYVNQHVWLDYNPSTNVSSRFQLYGSLGARFQLASDGWRKVVLQPNLRYSIAGSLRAYGGVGSFYTFNKKSSDRWELRPWQGVSFAWPRGRIVVDHLVRIEERIEYSTDTWETRVSLRARYRLRASIRWDETQEGWYWRALTSAEVLKRTTGESGQFNEQARGTVVLERGYGNGRRAQLELGWQRQGRVFDREPVSDLYIRVRIFQRFGQ